MVIPVKQGLSAPYVTTIPDQWDKQWFRNFITNFLANADIRNLKAGGGLVITGNVGANSTSATIALDDASPFTILGNPTASFGPAQDMSPGTTMSLLRTVTPVNWTGNHTFAATSGIPLSVTAPTGARAVNITGTSGQVSLNIISNCTPSQGVTDILLSRPGSTANTLFEGPSIELFDSTNIHSVTLQSSGGQIEIWQTISAASTQVAVWDTSNKLNIKKSAVVTAASATRALTLNGAAGQVSLSIVSASLPTSGVVDILVSRAGSTANAQFEGPSIELFDSTNTNATTIQNSGGQTEIWQTNGGSSSQVGVWDINKAFTAKFSAIVNGASGTRALIINGASNQVNLSIVSANGATSGAVEILVNRAGSTANAIFQGPSIELFDSASTNATTIQNSGGQTEIWQTNGGSSSQVALWTSSKALQIKTPTSILGSTSSTQEDITPDHGSFTATGTGFTVAPTSTVTWRKIGNLAEIHIVGITGTSNANTFTITGLPSNLQPATTGFQQMIVGATDNGAGVFAGLQVLSGSGTINVLLNGSTTGWTASGTKALGSLTMFYTLD